MEEFQIRSEAIKREKEIKKLSHSRKENLINLYRTENHKRLDSIFGNPQKGEETIIHKKKLGKG